MERILGLDVGNKTIGVAVNDALGLTAQGVTVIRRTTLCQDLAALHEIMQRYAAQEVAIGLPLHMNGSEGEQAAVARELGDLLREQGIKVVYVDERLSSQAAERALLEGDVSRRKRKEIIDMLAAQFILQLHLARRQSNSSV